MERTEVIKELVETLVAGYSITSKEVFDALVKFHGTTGVIGILVSDEVKDALKEIVVQRNEIESSTRTLDSKVNNTPMLDEVEDWLIDLKYVISDIIDYISDLDSAITRLGDSIDA